MADVSGITTTPLSFPTFAVEATVGPDGSVWMLTSSGKLGKIAPGGAYTELPLPFGQPQGGAIIASGLATGIDGNLWITGLNGHIARVTPNGTATDFPIAASFNGGDVSIVNGADDALWFLYPRSPATVKLGRIDIYGSVTTYDLGF
ncbi:MAG: hypothetical protein DMD33_19360, partial [Gemmatimonadetes bacterium]